MWINAPYDCPLENYTLIRFVTDWLGKYIDQSHRGCDEADLRDICYRSQSVTILLSHSVISYNIVSNHALFYHIIICTIFFFCIVWYNITSNNLILNCFPRYHILSWHILYEVSLSDYIKPFFFKLIQLLSSQNVKELCNLGR